MCSWVCVSVSSISCFEKLLHPHSANILLIAAKGGGGEWELTRVTSLPQGYISVPSNQTFHASEHSELSGISTPPKPDQSELTMMPFI